MDFGFTQNTAPGWFDKISILFSCNSTRIANKNLVVCSFAPLFCDVRLIMSFSVNLIFLSSWLMNKLRASWAQCDITYRLLFCFPNGSHHHPDSCPDRLQHSPDCCVGCILDIGKCHQPAQFQHEFWPVDTQSKHCVVLSWTSRIDYISFYFTDIIESTASTWNVFIFERRTPFINCASMLVC